MKTLDILDTSLRDGAQSRGISYSVEDKLLIVRLLDSLGVRYIEAGNPASNPKDAQFFKEARKLRLETSELCAFGSTVKKGLKAKNDPQIDALLSAETETVVIFGKSSVLQVEQVLGIPSVANLDMILETVSYLKEKGRRVIYDAEHFFDGCAENMEYALFTIKTAVDAGADCLVLCDTNGGAFPSEAAGAVKAVKSTLGGVPIGVPIGIHAHNDMGLAVALSLAAVEAGATHIQGTLTGIGERCGNTTLAALIPSLELKMGYKCLKKGAIARLTEAARTFSEIANMALPDNMPYVGQSAFAHKAGMHSDAIIKESASFEHIPPASVGNERSFLVSEAAGRAAVAERLKRFAPSIKKTDPLCAKVTTRLKELEAEGWQFEGADASFELLALREMGKAPPSFSLITYRVTSEHPSVDGIECSYAWVKVAVQGKTEIAGAEGDGPVNALDLALRRSLSPFYPALQDMRLFDYKVRVINGRDATAACVRVLIESTDGKNTWTTLGVSSDIIDASRLALQDAIEYKLRNG